MNFKNFKIGLFSVLFITAICLAMYNTNKLEEQFKIHVENSNLEQLNSIINNSQIRDISKEAKNEALWLAAKKGDFELVQLLENYVDRKIHHEVYAYLSKNKPDVLNKLYSADL